MDHAWTLPPWASLDAIGPADTKACNNLEDEDCTDRTFKKLRTPRGRPRLHPSPAVTENSPEETGWKRTWKRTKTYCSPSELREQHLHRNRVAASKYRQKHKTWSDALAERCRAEIEKRRCLQDLTRSLKEEVLSLKEQAIQQGGCDCMIMKLYLEHQKINLLGQPDSRSSMSPLATDSFESISPTSSSFASSFDDNFFSDLG